MRGFSLIELLLVIVIFGILTGISVPVFYNLKINNDLDLATSVVVQSLRRAQVYSRGVVDDSQWGVNILGNNLILFQGASYTDRNDNFDESFDLGKSISVSGDLEIVFSKYKGDISSDKHILLMADSGKQVKISINRKGIVNY